MFDDLFSEPEQIQEEHLTAWKVVLKAHVETLYFWIIFSRQSAMNITSLDDNWESENQKRSLTETVRFSDWPVWAQLNGSVQTVRGTWRVKNSAASLEKCFQVLKKKLERKQTK